MTNQEIYDLNKGRITAGDYFVVLGTKIDIIFTPYNINSVDIYLEKTEKSLEPYDILIQADVSCTSGVKTVYQWICDQSVNINDEYPIYRIKVVYSRSNSVIAYSNKFKIATSIG